MVTSIKIILAVWMAVFLALPSCPCQFFEPLGMAFPHQHEAGTLGEGNPDYNGLTEWGNPSDGSDQNLPICHCEEGLGKTAEECNQHEYAPPVQWASKINQDHSSHEATLLITRSSARAPPPDIMTKYWLKSARTGVYQL